MKQFVMILLALLGAFNVMAQTNRIYIEDFELEPGQTDTVPVMMICAEPSRGLQFFISVSQGLDIVDSEMTAFSREYTMSGSCNYSSKNDAFLMFIYPADRVCYPADTLAAIVNIIVEADPSFEGGTITTWKCRGSTMENDSFDMAGDTARVSLPSASVILIPEDNQPTKNQYFNLMGQPIDTPDSTSVAIQVTTSPNGERKARKVAKGH